MSVEASTPPEGRRRRVGALARALGILRETGERWAGDHCYSLGASLAYYALFAIFPLLLLCITALGAVLGSDAFARARILELYARVGSADMLPVLDQTLASMETHQPGRGLSLVVGAFMLVFGASGVFSELDSSFNVIWGVKRPKTVGFWAAVRETLEDKALAFALVGIAGLAIAASMFLRTVLQGVLEAAGTFLPSAVLGGVDLAASFIVLTAVFAALFRVLPRTYVAWRDVLGGAAVTALLVIALKWLFATCLAGLWSYAVYGAVGAVLGLLTWIYLMSQLIFFGAELTRVYAERAGSRAKPRPEVDAAPLPLGRTG